MKTSSRTSRRIKLIVFWILKFSLLFQLVACSKSPTAKILAPQFSPKLSKGQGLPWQENRTVLTIKTQELLTASGDPVCHSGDRNRVNVEPKGRGEKNDCPLLKSLAEQSGNNGFGDGNLALDIPRDTPAAALAQPLSILANYLPGIALYPVCLRASVEGFSRCVPAIFRTRETMNSWMSGLEPLAKLRLIIRRDGMEIVTRHGKIPGPDRFGPSIPAPKGIHNFALLYQGVSKLSARFPEETEVAVLASGQTTVQTLVTAMDTMRRASGNRFRRFLLIYQPPALVDSPNTADADKN